MCKKTKLQELCHRNRWGLPKYSAMKDGPDHDPRFKASVSVNGIFFNSTNSCMSLKEAHNDAANQALLHFSSHSPPKTSPKASSESNAGETYSDDKLPCDNLATLHGDGQYKSILQRYARLTSLGMPIYSTKSEGPAHALRFKANVRINARSFESAGHLLKTLKEAENDAAKAALMSLPTTDGFQIDDYACYKTLLQELAQRKKFSVPVYKTKKSGEAHMAIFYSSVEVEGDIFHGTAGKSKKEAEMKAAKVAYAVLKEGEAKREPGCFSDGIEGLSCTEEILMTPKKGSDAKTKRLEPYLLCNRVRVYPFYPDIDFPEGITVMPISEDKWVAVRLEF